MALTSSLTEKRKKYFTNAGYGQSAEKAGNAQSWKDKLNGLYNEISNRKFTYDQSQDPLAEQYKRMYEQNARLAMQDTVGKASALTGGYANSYAQTAGQAIYNQQMGQMNERALELAQLAENRYQRETDNLYNQLSTAANMYAQEYGEEQAAAELAEKRRQFDAQQEAEALKDSRDYRLELLKNGYNADGTVNEKSLDYLKYEADKESSDNKYALDYLKLLADREGAENKLAYDYAVNGYNADGTVDENSYRYAEYIRNSNNDYAKSELEAQKAALEEQKMYLDAAQNGWLYDENTGGFVKSEKAEDLEKAKAGYYQDENGEWLPKQTKGQELSDQKYRTEVSVKEVKGMRNLDLPDRYLNPGEGKKKPDKKWINSQIKVLDGMTSDFARAQYINSLQAEYDPKTGRKTKDGIGETLAEALFKAYGLTRELK